MKRRTNTQPARIWTYGCLRPIVNAQIVQEQLSAAHRYYNTLIEIERQRRVEYREARSSLTPIEPYEQAVADLKAKLDTQRLELKGKSKEARKRVKVDKGASNAVKETVTALREARKALREARKEVASNPALMAATEAITERANQRVRDARKASGCFWGVYLLCEKAVESARKSKVDPRFRRWSGEGRVGVQLHHEKIADIMKGIGTSLQIDPLPDDQWSDILNPDGTKKRTKRQGARSAKTTVRIRVGSTGAGNREPVWAEFPVLVHRPPPPDATVAWAWIKVTRVGPDTRYELQLVLESTSFETTSTLSSASALALDLGWRVKPSGDIRVAYGIGSDGAHHEVVLPASIRSGLAHCDSLRSYQDQHFNAARIVLKTWMDQHPQHMTETLKTGTAYMHAWHSPAKLARLTGQLVSEVWDENELRIRWDVWVQQRLNAQPRLDLFDTFETITGECAAGRTRIEQLALYLEWWRRKNRHLYSWQANLRDKLLGRRRDAYRVFAAKMRDRYAVIVVEDFDLRKFARNANPEDQKTQDFLHRIQKDAAPSEFRGALVSACGKNRVLAEDAVDSTRACHFCGHVNTAWEQPDRLVQNCAGCKADWDQDENAARNLLGRWQSRGGPAPSEAEAAE